MMYEEVVIPQREYKDMIKGKGRFFNRPTTSKGKKYDKFFMYIPAEVARDSSFPLNDGDRIEIEIKGNSLIIKKSQEEN